MTASSTNLETMPTSRSWTESVAAGTGEVTIDFDHNTNFVDIGASATSEGGDFSLVFSDMTPHVGQILELRVRDVDTTQVRGLYLLMAVPGASFTIEIDGIIEDGHNYEVDFYADLNGNTFYDAPSTDHAWRMTGMGGASGLSLNFVHNVTDFTDVEF